MKLIIISFAILLSAFTMPTDIYKTKVQALDGTNISFSDFKGKKILIAEFNAQSPDRSFLSYLEWLKNSSKDLIVIAVPAIDFSSDKVKPEALVGLQSMLRLSYLILQPQEVKKKNASKQSALFKWLTYNDENGHFNEDVSGEGEVYLISEKGTLYALLKAGTPKALVTELSREKVE